MRLFGFQCDNCKVRSKDKPGSWTEVITMRVSADGEWYNTSAIRSDGSHFCSKECLVEYMTGAKK